MGQAQLLTRREFLAALGGLAALAGCRGTPATEIAGEIVGSSHKLGHRLRSGNFPRPAETARAGIVVVGGGVSGLSAGWKLERSGFQDFQVLELEDSAGGNARWGENSLTRYPWGAHYIPLPESEARAVCEVLTDLKVQTGTDKKGRPVFDERYVCFAPQERLFIHGSWQEGIAPRTGLSDTDTNQFTKFEREMDQFRRRRSVGGGRAFAIPMESSTRDEDLLALDRVSMAEWLDRRGYTSAPLRWFVEYACRDDYGSLLGETSAWAAIHYFAGRSRGAGGEVLTWPEGNGFVARRLAARLGTRVRTSALAFDVVPTADGVRVDWLDARTGRAQRTLARAAIVCLPVFVAGRVIEPLRRAKPAWLAAFSYAPWMVANLTVHDPPEGRGFPTCWDNVLYRGQGLGYVDAGHQSLASRRRDTVWTYFRPLTGPDSAQARRDALEAPWSRWRDLVLDELKAPHPELRERVRRLDVMVWGHAMVKPRPGLLWGGARQEALKPLGPVFLGHSDLSGLPLFEEALTRGVAAAQGAMRRLGHPFTVSA